MQDHQDHDLEPFFAAARDAEHTLPETARRRMLLDAEFHQPKPKPTRAGLWSLFNLIKFAPAGAAMASLSLGLFLGMWQPDGITSLAGFELQNIDPSTLFGSGFESVFDESELNG